jgi:hypothetical protein
LCRLFQEGLELLERRLCHLFQEGLGDLEVPEALEHH